MTDCEGSYTVTTLIKVKLVRRIKYILHLR